MKNFLRVKNRCHLSYLLDPRLVSPSPNIGTESLRDTQVNQSSARKINLLYLYHLQKNIQVSLKNYLCLFRSISDYTKIFQLYQLGFQGARKFIPSLVCVTFKLQGKFWTFVLDRENCQRRIGILLLGLYGLGTLHKGCC